MHGQGRGEVTDDGLLHPPAELVDAVPARWDGRAPAFSRFVMIRPIHSAAAQR
jgi:hypothetical protein